MSERKSFVELSQLPEKFWEVLIVFNLILTISPFFSGLDFGVFKVPKFSPYWNSILFPIGLGLLILNILAFRKCLKDSFEDRAYRIITAILAVAILIEILLIYFYPTILIEKVELNYISSRGVAHLSVDGKSHKLFSNDFKIFVFSRVIPDKQWWYDRIAETDVNPQAKNWKIEAIAGNNSDGQRICKKTEIEIIAIGSTEDEMNQIFAKNTSKDATYIQYYETFPIRSEVSKIILEPDPIPICCVNDKHNECEKK